MMKSGARSKKAMDGLFTTSSIIKQNRTEDGHIFETEAAGDENMPDDDG